MLIWSSRRRVRVSVRAALLAAAEKPVFGDEPNQVDGRIPTVATEEYFGSSKIAQRAE
jgi:hypothetical protein